MDITASTSRLTHQAAEAQPGTVRGAAALSVLRRALDQDATAAAQLLQALPPQPALASSGPLGTRLNTYA